MLLFVQHYLATCPFYATFTVKSPKNYHFCVFMCLFIEEYYKMNDHRLGNVNLQHQQHLRNHRICEKLEKGKLLITKRIITRNTIHQNVYNYLEKRMECLNNNCFWLYTSDVCSFIADNT
uniref:Uncharacterized protein n=1 Tax=Megaselia scalaris TaxID=36166 RepID=T1GQE8_MEGSC